MAITASLHSLLRIESIYLYFMLFIGHISEQLQFVSALT